MSTINVVLLGFGTVGEGVYQIIKSRHDQYKEHLGLDINVKGVLVKNEQKVRHIDQDVKVTSYFSELLNMDDIDVVIEAIVGFEPGFSYLKQVLARGIPVISANKELIAHKGKQLKQLAQYNDTEIYFEASVGGGIPVIGVINNLLHVNDIRKIEGILNGTSNFILTTMRETGCSFDEALQIAQDKGYAEADPSNDVLGWDAFYKLMVLSELVYGKQPVWDHVKRMGIDQVTLEDIQEADQRNERIKLIASLEKNEDGGLSASLHPISVDSLHPLYGVEGVDNAININTDLLGDLMLKGAGAGALPTASAILEDLTLLFRHAKKSIRTIALQ